MISTNIRIFFEKNVFYFMEVLKLIEGDSLSLIIPRVFVDERGYFYESFNDKEFKELVCNTTFVQDNQSKSSYGILRGFHFQQPPYAQSKLVRVTSGMALDVAVDIRPESPTFKKYYFTILSEKNKRQFFIPKGFAHAFLSLADNTIFQYKCDEFYNKESEGSIYYADPSISFPWGIFINEEDIILSEKDANAPLLNPIATPTETE